MDIFFGIIKSILLAIFLACLLALPVKWLWNDLAPALFNLPEITFWQALELNILCSVLFSNSSSSSSNN